MTRLTAILALLTLPAPWAGAQEAERWSLLASLSASYSNNLFLIPGGGIGDTIGGGYLGLTWARTRLDYDLAVTGWVFGATYSEFRNLGGLRGGAAFNGRFSSSRISRFRVSQLLSKGFNPRRLYGGGALLPQLDVASSTTYVGWNYEASPSTALDLSGDINWLSWSAPTFVGTGELSVDTFPEQVTPPTPEDVENPPFFEQPDPSLFLLSQIASEGVLSNNLSLLTTRVGPSLTHSFSDRTRGDVAFAYRWSRWEGTRPLQGSFVGRTGLWELRTSVRRQLTPTADLSLRYAFQRGTDFSRIRTHNIAGQFDKSFSERFRVDGFLGYSNSGGEGIESVGTWVGGLGLSLRYRRGGVLLRLSRTAYQPLGFGRVLATNFAFASASWIPVEKVAVGAYGGMTSSRDQFDPTFDYESQFVGVFGSYRISRRFTLGGNYAFRRYQFGLLPGASASIIGASISYLRVWK